MLRKTTNWETTMIDRIARALGLAIALAGVAGASVNAQQSSAGIVGRTHQEQDTTHRTTEPSPTAADSQKVAVATTSASTGRGRGLMKRATAAAASAAKTVKSVGGKEDAAEAVLIAAGKGNPSTLMIEELLREQQRDHARAAAAQAAREAKADAAMATATAQMSASIAAMSTGPSIADPAAASVESDPELAAARTAYTGLVARAASGDRNAARQLERFQRELTAAAPALNALPASQQQNAYGVALRDALACATSGKGCRTR